MSDPLRITLIHTADHGGGAEASVVSLHNALLELGHQSNLYVGTKHTQLPHVHAIQRHRCIPGVLRTAKWAEDRLGWQYVYHPWFRKLDRKFRDHADVIHFHSLWSGRLGYADVGGLPRLSRLFPSLMTLRDMWMLSGHCAYPAVDCDRWKTGCGQCPDLSLAPAIDVDGTAHNWQRKRKMIQRSNIRVITVSDWLRQQVQSCPIFDNTPVFTVYNGLDEGVFCTGNQQQARSQLNIPSDAFVVMLAGQSVEGTFNRGGGAVDFALQALDLNKPDVFPLFVGHSASAVATRWGQPCRALPFQTPADLATCYRAANLTLVASQRETFGRIPAESQLCGTPVVAFRNGGLTEVVMHEQTGLLVDDEDAVGLGAAVQQLNRSREQLAEFSAQAAQSAAKRFGNAAIATAYVDHYRSVIRERSQDRH